MTETNPWIEKMRRLGALTEKDIQALDAVSARARFYDRGDVVIRSGDVAEWVPVLLEGFSCRYQCLSDGRRQISGFLLPGDMCVSGPFQPVRNDSDVEALMACRIALVLMGFFNGLPHTCPNLMGAVWRSLIIETAIGREWLMNLGRRTAYERTAHLFCELLTRLDAVGLVDGGRFFAPLTQKLLADALGLSVVHVNRTMRRLQSEELMDMRRTIVRVHDRPELRIAAQFSGTYLDGLDSKRHSNTS